MSNPPEYQQSLVYPSAPSADQGGYVGAPVPPSGVVPPYPPYPAAGSSQYPSYPMPPPAYPQPMPSYPPYGAAAPVPPPTKTGYNQPPYQASAAAYGSDSYGSGYNGGAEDIQFGNQQNITDDGTAVWATDSFSDKKIRQQFIKKVYLILMSQLFFTFGVVCLFFFSQDVKFWVRRNQWFYWCSYAVFLITYITLVCCDGVRRRWPANIICLCIFTAAFSYMTGTITSFYDTQSVMVALGITAAVCLAVSIFAIQTKIDFTLCSGLIFALCMVFIMFGFACMITYLVAGRNYILETVYGALAAGLFSLFLIFDTQMVVGGHKRRYQLSPEEHIYGALQLYVDVVNLFIIILGLFGKRS